MSTYRVEKLCPLAFRVKVHNPKLGRLFVEGCGSRYLVLVDDDSRTIYVASGLYEKCREAIEKIKHIAENIERYRDCIITP